MRLLFVTLAVTLAVAGCVVPTDSTSGAGEGDAATTCDGKNDCAQCSSCASQVACASQLSACQNDSACVAIDQCVAICGADVTCKQGCIDNNPSGAAAYDAATRCLYCTECAKDCAGYRVCS